MATPPPRPARTTSFGNVQQAGAPPQRGRFAVPDRGAKGGNAPQRGGPSGRSRRGPRGGNPVANQSPIRKPPPAVPPRSTTPPTPAPRAPSRANRGINRRERSISIIMHENENEDDSEESSSEQTSSTPNEDENAPKKSMVHREACLARSIICLDQNLFMAQIKAEEEMERRMSMVRHNVPLPTVPQPSQPALSHPPPTKLPAKPQTPPPATPSHPPPNIPTNSSAPLRQLKLHSQRCTENIEAFIQQVHKKKQKNKSIFYNKYKSQSLKKLVTFVS